MGSRRAAIAGFAEWAPQRKWPNPLFTLEAFARLTKEALDDAGMELGEVDGVLTTSPVPESRMFAPSAVSEYLGIPTAFAEIVDLGGSSGAGMIWRAVAAIEAGACDTAICVGATIPPPPNPKGKFDPSRAYLGADAWGAPHGQFDIPYGLINPNSHFAMVAQRYMHEYKLKPETLAKIAVQQRDNAQANPQSQFQGQPISVDDVLNSPMIVDPLHMLEIVMPSFGGVGIVVTTLERAQQLQRHRPVVLTGFGEQVTHKSITYAPTLTAVPIKAAADRAFKMAGVERKDIDMAALYDCYTITVLLTIEDSGFCGKGEGEHFVEEHDLRFTGDWPLNTNGGQLSLGQAGIAGGMCHITDALEQLTGRAGERQLKHCERAFVSGTGGFMSEQAALILEGA
jgi:acetyl-CoA C-acetyltransferase